MTFKVKFLFLSFIGLLLENTVFAVTTVDFKNSSAKCGNFLGTRAPLNGHFNFVDYPDQEIVIFQYTPQDSKVPAVFLRTSKSHGKSNSKTTNIFIERFGQANMYKPDAALLGLGIGSGLVRYMVDYFGPKTTYSAELAWHNAWAIGIAVWGHINEKKDFRSNKEFDSYRQEKKWTDDEVSQLLVIPVGSPLKSLYEEQMIKAIRFCPIARAMAEVGYTQISDVKIQWINSGGVTEHFPMVTDVIFSKPE